MLTFIRKINASVRIYNRWWQPVTDTIKTMNIKKKSTVRTTKYE